MKFNLKGVFHMLTKSANNLPKNLSDHELHIEVERKASAEKTATLELLEYLHEIDVRRVYALMGYSNLWEYVCKYLKYSEYQASEKINTMRWQGFLKSKNALLKINSI